MRPALLQALPPLLPLLSVLAGLAALAAGEPCLDGLGLLHGEGERFYDFPDAPRPCRVFECVNGQKLVLRDRCAKKIDNLPSSGSATANLQTPPLAIQPDLGVQDKSEDNIRARSGLQTGNISSATPDVQFEPPNPRTSVLPVSFNPSSPSLQPVPPPVPAPASGAASASAPVPVPAPESEPESAPESAPDAAPESAHESAPAPDVVTVSASSPVSAVDSSVIGSGDSRPLSALRVSTCRAKNGRMYYEGQGWWETDGRPCHQYVCRSSQKLLVQNVTCERLPDGCTGQFVLGECCPKPTDDCGRLRPTPVPVPPQGCTSTDGRTYQKGQTWYETAAKPCARYVCTTGGRRQLIHNIVCDPPNPLCRGQLQVPGTCCPKQTQCGCLERGAGSVRQPRLHGERWPSAGDPCVILTCDEGQVSEQRHLPQPQPCPPPTDNSCVAVPPPPGVCACPTYQCTPPTPRQPAIRPTAPQIDTPPLPTEGSRTADPSTTTTTTALRPATSCEFDGTIYRNTQTWRHECRIYGCLNGTVASEHVWCPDQTDGRCAPIYQPGSCCVRWSCQSKDIDKVCKDPGTGKSHFCYTPGKHEGICNKTSRTSTKTCCPVFECLKNCRDQGGKQRNHSTSWEADCIIYSCWNGTVTSREKDCPEPGDAQCRLTNPGECCPSYDCDCEVNGRRYDHGSLWVSDCADHSCALGEVTSRPMSCPDPPRPDCQPLPLAGGQCCAEFQCSCRDIRCRAPPRQPGCLQSGVSADGCCTLYSCPGDCRDDEDRVHPDESRWFVKCNQYRCSGGNITEATAPCPPAPNSDCKKVFLQDVCCPVYDCPSPSCVIGERSFDGCNHCECFPPGKLLCTNSTCQKKGCSIGRQQLEHNETYINKKANPCYNYSCKYGTVFNSVIQCPPKPSALCSEAAPAEGQCCPGWVCPRAACPDPSDVTGTHRRHWEDDCNVCTCTDSGVVCTEFDCHKQCQQEGKYYDTQEVMPGREDCGESVCIDGAPISIYQTCQTSPNFTCQATDAFKDGCCFNWFCEDLPGIPAPCQVGQILQGGQECMHCECIEDARGLPRMLCTKRDCVNTGCEDGTAFHEHGSIWSSTNRCQQRACVSGQVVEMTIQCPEPPQGCVPVPDDHRCCPLYYCGEKCKDGDTSKRGCNSCFCRDGVEFCTTNQCDHTEGEDEKTEHE